ISTTRTPSCYAPTSVSVARSVRVASPVTACSTSVTLRSRSRMPARWRCCPLPPRRGNRLAQNGISETMKLILTADVDHLGTVGDTVEVKDGYGRNFLLPRGLAPAASRAAAKKADEIRRARETKTVRDLEHANEIKSAIEALGPVSLPVKAAADSGKLFGSVTTGDVVAAIKKAGGPNLDQRIIRPPQT